MMWVVAFMCLKSGGRKLLLKDLSQKERERKDITPKLGNFSSTETTRN